jgi:soluble lytic murein transglycosylase-like protein
MRARTYIAAMLCVVAGLSACSRHLPSAPAIIVEAVAAPEVAATPVPNVPAVPPPPARAAQYQRAMTESARRVFGWGAPTATLAAQIHQESGWREDARSHAGALGIAQFMPATAEDMAARHRACAPARPLDAEWSFRCRDRYMHSRLAAIQTMATGFDECGHWTFALRAYNGGLGWVQRDRRLALARGLNPDAPEDVAQVNAGRSAAAFRENVEYAAKIHRLAARYAAHGWGRSVCA